MKFTKFTRIGKAAKLSEGSIEIGEDEAKRAIVKCRSRELKGLLNAVVKRLREKISAT